MATLRFHSGRMMLLERFDGWAVRIKCNDEITIVELDSKSLNDAILEAEQVYSDARTVLGGTANCFQCVFWLPELSECFMEFPEGRKTGGRYASKCPVFKYDKSNKKC